MSAAMSVSTCMDFLTFDQSGFLGKSGKCVVLCQDSDIRPSLSIRSRKSCFDIACATFHLESLFLQGFTVSFCRFEFLKGKLRKFPDPVGNAGDQISFVFNRLQCRLFFCCHVSYLLSKKGDQNPPVTLVTIIP